ncbi:VrrA/YqfQ family protein [Sporosarcina sp. D27]|uniref:VrrA/YqfQ family protein n=1 Tax=Sporosarcina sp. D27 TaxID=1382305 RepID=UPI000472FB20|nr:VrrA/YqfQ family protein [Sporosarcina sp. D27]
MRYQSFYPFANQQRQAPAGQQMFRGNFQQAKPFTQGPAAPFAQGQANQQPSPFGMDPGFGGQQQTQGGAPTRAGLSKPEMYMETANRFMTTVQQYAPMVQQFAPMLQNIPAMWKLYRGFQSLPDAGIAGASAAASVARGAAPVPSGPRPSVPKVFQPPI